MSSVEDLEKLRAKAQIKHGQTIRRLEMACTRDAVNNRVVAQLVDQLEVDFHWLVESHVMLVLKMSSSWRSLYTRTR